MTRRFSFLVVLMAARMLMGACDPPPKRPIEYVHLPGKPFMAVPSADGCTVFVSLSAADGEDKSGIAVVRNDGRKFSLARIARVDGDPTGMVLTHDGRLLIVANGPGVLFLDTARLISGKGNAVAGYIEDRAEVPADTARYMGAARVAHTHIAGSDQVNVTKDDRFLFVADEFAQAITVIDLKKGLKAEAVVGRIPVGVLPVALVFSPDEKFLYTTSEIGLQSFGWPATCEPEGQDSTRVRPKNPEGAILVVDVAKAESDPANAVMAKTPAGCSPVRLAITASGDAAFVTARKSNAVLRFDTAKLVADPTHARTGEAAVGSAPVGIAVTPDGSRVIATNSNRFAGHATDRQTLSVIDAKTMTVTGSIAAGAFPREIRFASNGRTMFVTNFASNELEIVDLSRAGR